ncbi:MAG TPA: hypothetical protein VG457_09120, partial [Planctomycetota bacterium]|nr:hypothetical protein [Planctomycetota bacterium]
NGPVMKECVNRVRAAGIKGNNLLLQLSNHEMWCYDLPAKKLAWMRSGMVLGNAVPLLLEDRLCFASVKANVDADQEAILYSVNLRSGNDLWSVSLGGAWRPGTFYDSSLSLGEYESLILASWNPPPHR